MTHTEERAPCELFQAYEAARDEAELALADWSAAAVHTKREAFTVYRAATDREDAAAFAWLRSCEQYDAAQSPVSAPGVSHAIDRDLASGSVQGMIGDAPGH